MYFVKNSTIFLYELKEYIMYFLDNFVIGILN